MEREETTSDEVEGNYTRREARTQNLISSLPLMHLMKYVVPSVLVLITVKYQGKTESLFWKNPVPSWCFIAAICVYWPSVGAMKQITNIDSKWFQIARRAALASGVLSAFSLLSMFLTYTVSLVPPLIWIAVFGVLAWPSHAYSLANRGIECTIRKKRATVVWAKGLDSMQDA